MCGGACPGVDGRLGYFFQIAKKGALHRFGQGQTMGGHFGVFDLYQSLKRDEKRQLRLAFDLGHVEGCGERIERGGVNAEVTRTGKRGRAAGHVGERAGDVLDDRNAARATRVDANKRFILKDQVVEMKIAVANRGATFGVMQAAAKAFHPAQESGFDFAQGGVGLRFGGLGGLGVPAAKVQRAVFDRGRGIGGKPIGGQRNEGCAILGFGAAKMGEQRRAGYERNDHKTSVRVEINRFYHPQRWGRHIGVNARKLGPLAGETGTGVVIKGKAKDHIAPVLAAVKERTFSGHEAQGLGHLGVAPGVFEKRFKLL